MKKIFALVITFALLLSACTKSTPTPTRAPTPTPTPTPTLAPTPAPTPTGGDTTDPTPTPDSGDSEVSYRDAETYYVYENVKPLIDDISSRMAAAKTNSLARCTEEILDAQTVEKRKNGGSFYSTSPYQYYPEPENIVSAKMARYDVGDTTTEYSLINTILEEKKKVVYEYYFGSYKNSSTLTTFRVTTYEYSESITDNPNAVPVSETIEWFIDISDKGHHYVQVDIENQQAIDASQSARFGSIINLLDRTNNELPSYS